MTHATGEHKHANHLVHETSPYLLQHAHNPVDWHPWSEEALSRAREEDKPIFLSIGYAACHWCHVMERESFENEAIARFLNDHFINIKVDREERPDIDEIYMMATQLVTGSGGWPMSVFLTPDLQPFYAGTYFPPDDRWGRPGFLRLITALDEHFRTNRNKIEASAREIATAVERALAAPPASATLSEDLIGAAVESILQRFDPLYGGFGGAPKFPHTMDLLLLLRDWRRTQDPEIIHAVTYSLDRMARGGMYDQLAGGFHRYSVDDRWLIPHFEKMLYDNALLARTYLEAFQATGEESLARIAREILDYAIREMQSPEGGYYSSTDADSEGEEGKFFVWTPEEVEAVLGPEDARVVCEYYDVRPGGNFEHTGKSALAIPRIPADVAEKLGMPLENLLEVVARARPKLLAERSKRVPPGLDDKILTDWNGLMISAMAFGGFVLSEERYLESARRAGEAMLRFQWDGERLLHTRRAGRSHLEGMLSDHANLVMGLLDLYEATLEPRWLRSALEIHARQLELFWDDKDGGFFNTLDRQADLLIRSKSANDGATPSGNSVAALNLARLGFLTGDTNLLERANRTFLAFGDSLRRAGAGFPQMLIGLDLLREGGDTLVLVSPGGKGLEEFLKPLRGRFSPYLVWIASDPALAPLSVLLAGKTPMGDAPTAYVCRGTACLPPTANPSEVLEKIR